MGKLNRAIKRTEEKKISELNIGQSKLSHLNNREKNRSLKNEKSLRGIWGLEQSSNIKGIVVSEGDRRESETGKVFKEITENSPYLAKNINLQSQEVA